MNPKVKMLQMAMGVDMIGGSRTSISATATTSMEATAIGIKVHSKKTNRTVVIPYGNLRGFELLPEPVSVPEVSGVTVEELAGKPKAKKK